MNLTQRQREVASLISRGLSNAQIGKSLGISPNSVRMHVTGILDRLGVHNRTLAAVTWDRMQRELS